MEQRDSLSNISVQLWIYVRFGLMVTGQCCLHRGSSLLTNEYFASRRSALMPLLSHPGPGKIQHNIRPYKSLFLRHKIEKGGRAVYPGPRKTSTIKYQVLQPCWQFMSELAGWSLACCLQRRILMISDHNHPSTTCIRTFIWERENCSELAGWLLESHLQRRSFRHGFFACWRVQYMFGWSVIQWFRRAKMTNGNTFLKIFFSMQST